MGYLISTGCGAAIVSIAAVSGGAMGWIIFGVLLIVVSMIAVAEK